MIKGFYIMNKFYLGMLIISFLYGCSTTSSIPTTQINESSTLETRPYEPVVITEPPPCSTKEVGKAAAKMLKRKGYLSDDDCR